VLWAMTAPAVRAVVVRRERMVRFMIIVLCSSR
jgi:hypothetical protein